ncbi:MinD/ParA family protein [Priestia flexa]|uniref:MinD/ParA family protein n=1 Tax=Priestia flexa TaxID=86664 RepID=UPI000E68E68D|nr:MinD/ParA family protein [Priestia flexa]MBN8434610.1 MinD/ParA family protein [Priestia flexa]MCA0967149.1 MinD/ParA family protein [Priestia flexa]RIV15790.1 MinD/ParA family protein [Priestia flexa]UIR28988.1 MinD/ParA family protein [Priestia flexa]
MNDQAAALRKRVAAVKHGSNQRTEAKTLAVISGKGGVGKSNFSLNFSLSLQEKGYRVLLFDMDIGMGNIDVLMGIASTYTIVDMLENKWPIQRVIKQGPKGLSYIAGGSGITSLFEWKQNDLHYLIDQFNSVSQDYDYLIFDMGAGMTEGVIAFLKAMDDMVLITTPEPTSITDCYAALKFLHLYDVNASFKMVVNKSLSIKEGVNTYERFNQAAKQFLKCSIELLGTIAEDRCVSHSVNSQVPFILQYPKGSASQGIKNIVNQYATSSSTRNHSVGFVAKLKKLFLER